MPIKFSPVYSITSKAASCLMYIEAVKERVNFLPLTSTVIASLRETAKLYTTHYSTMIEGNRLNAEQVKKILKEEDHFPGRERDETEIKGYYAALNKMEQWLVQKTLLSEFMIQKTHALVMSDGRMKIKPSVYRDGQNVIKDSRTKNIVYMPPEAKDVPLLMQSLIQWVHENKETPCPIVTGIAHYQFATIHPYYDGNGRTARLLTTFLLHQGGYDLKGIYSLEEYYAKNLGAYYEAISIGPSHNYYLGRAEADITKWLEYFLEGMANAFENVLKHMNDKGVKEKADQSDLLSTLDPKKRKALQLFHQYPYVTAAQVGSLFGFKPRTCSLLCKTWAEEGFIKAIDHSKKGRKYCLADEYHSLLG